MGEKGMDAGGMSSQVSAVSAGNDAEQQMGDQLARQAPEQPPPQSSGPDAGEIVGDILDPLGIHKLFE
ncbi:MAG: hypothetical protein ACXWOT_11405 [Candidatus Limnocylindrales bacterium]